MPSKQHSYVRLAAVALCAVGLAGCNVKVVNQSPYWRLKAADNVYPLTLKVEEGSNADVQTVEVSVNGQWRPMAAAGQTWAYNYAQDTAAGLKLVYRVKYKHPSWLFVPTQTVIHLPSQGEWEAPILDQDADSDADGTRDRSDNCVYQPNPDQAFGPSYTSSLNFVRLGKLCDPAELGLDHITVSQALGAGDVLMRDNTGHHMLTEDGKPYYAFKTLVNSTGTIVDIAGINGLSTATRSVEVSDCSLVYQDRDDGWGGWFMEVYAADGAHPCSFAIKQAGMDLVTGTEILIVVRTRVEPGLPHVADMYGRVTLAAPPSGAPADAQALFAALTANSPTHYAYFSNPRLSTLVDTGGSVGPNVEGRFGGTSYIVFRH